MGCSLPGSSVYGIFQAIVLEWIAISFSRGSLQPGDRTGVSHIVDRRFTVWATRGSHFIGKETETLYKLRVYPAIIPLEEVRPQTSLWERPLLPPLYYPLPLASTTIFFIFCLSDIPEDFKLPKAKCHTLFWTTQNMEHNAEDIANPYGLGILT